MQHDRTGEGGCLVTLDHFGTRFVRRTLQARERIRALIHREFTLQLFCADIYPSSMDAIAVEVARPGRYHRGR
jgi:hypothetical protein